jgi:hypothetical protein
MLAPGSSVILLDRSRWKTGHECPRKRFYEYNLGGRGIRPRAQSLPLATGSAIHAPLAEILQTLIKGDIKIDRAFIRQVIASHVATYRASTLASGFSDEPGMEGSAEVKYVVDEQATLIEGMVWAFYQEFLPWLQKEFEVLAAEQEVLYVIGCTCGLGDGVGAPEDHGRRTLIGPGVHNGKLEYVEPCKGVALMLRPDFIAKRRSDGALGVWDFKTTSYGLDQTEYEHSVQMALGCLAAEKLFNEPCGHYYLVGFRKGKREGAWSAETKSKSGLKKQSSPLCYGYYKAPSPPVQKEAWAPDYQRGSAWAKVPIWEAYFADRPAEMSRVEFWIQNHLGEKLKEQMEILGPCQRPEHLLGEFLSQLVYGEEEWAERVRVVAEDPGQLHAVIPQSWDCHQFGRACEFLAICRKYPGLETPEAALTSDAYEAREPNHQAEKEALNG